MFGIFLPSKILPTLLNTSRRDSKGISCRREFTTVFALQLRSIQIETDSDAIVGVSTVVQIISIAVVVHVYVIVVVPIAVPVFRPGIHKTEPIAAVMETTMSTDIPYLEIGEAESVVLAIVAAETVLRNAVTTVTAALLPRAVLRLPAMCTRTLPCDLLLANLSRAPSLSICIGLLLLTLLPLLILLTPGLLLLLLALLVLLPLGLLLFCGVVLLLTLLPLLILLPLGLLLLCGVVLLLALLPRWDPPAPGLLLFCGVDLLLALLRC